MGFFKMVIQLRSICRDQEAWKLTTGSSSIIMFKDVMYPLALTLRPCKSTQNGLESTCPWNSLKEVEHLICQRICKSELPEMHMVVYMVVVCNVFVSLHLHLYFGPPLLFDIEWSLLGLQCLLFHFVFDQISVDIVFFSTMKI